MPDGQPIGTLRLFARSENKTSVDTMDFFKEWLGELGIDSEVTAMESNKLTNVILDGEFDAFQWGWYVEPDPDSMLSYMTCDQRGGWSDSWYCNEEYDELYEQQNGEHRRRRAGRDRQADAGDPLRGLALPRDGVHHHRRGRRSDRFACFQPQPDPGGIWLFQYGAHNYLELRPADEAGDCDGVDHRARAPTASPRRGGGSDRRGGATRRC